MELLQAHIQSRYGVVFRDVSLLHRAFTHSSYANEHRQLQLAHNERMEFLGDAVLEIIVSDYLYHTFSQWSEGQMTRFRAQIVCEPTLSALAKECGFDRFVRLGKGEEAGGGRRRPALLCDLFESFVGALYLDQGIDTARVFINQVLIPKITAGDFELFVDYKTRLQEFLQRSGAVNLRYVIENEHGPAHRKLFEVALYLEDERVGEGTGKNKKAAEQLAAKQALSQLAPDEQWGN